jgi:hypothetical protein
MTSVCCLLSATSLHRPHDWWHVPVALVGTGIPLAVGFILYFQSRRAAWGIAGAYFFFGTLTSQSYRLWPALTEVLAAAAVVCFMTALLVAPEETERRQNGEPPDSRGEGSDSGSRAVSA